MFTSVIFLILCLVVLFLGPILHPLLNKRHNLMSFLDGFVLTAVLALLFCHILPHAMESQGFLVLLVAFLGMMLPTALEKLGHKFATVSHKTTICLAIVGLAFHMFADGVALIQPESLHEQAQQTYAIVPFTIFLHSIPMALMVWWIIRPATSQKWALLILLSLAASLILGFIFGFYVATSDHPASFGLFEGLVMGSLLHVMFHRHGAQKHGHTASDWQWASGMGSLLAIVLGIFLNAYLPVFSHSHFWQDTSALFYRMALLSAPALLLAYLAGGFIQVFLPKASVGWLQKGSAPMQSFKGMIFGLPLPVCSCGVVPLYKSLIHRGAPLASALAFFVATPELGFDAILISLPLLGKTMMWIRLFAAAIVAFLVGWLMSFLQSHERNTTPATQDSASHLTIKQKIFLSLQSAFGEIVDHTGPWIVVGLLVAALVEPLLSTNILKNFSPFLQVPIFALIGMPIYVCASGATPLVAVLMANGVSPGAALAFLITGPATNVTTFGILSKLHGKKVAFCFPLLIFVMTVLLGMVINLFFPSLETPKILHEHAHAESWWQTASLMILALVFVGLLIRKGPRHLVNQIIAFEEEPHESEDHAAHITEKKSSTDKKQNKESCCH